MLKCRAFKLYPRSANLTWLQDGEPTHQGTFGSGAILPSGDGTYQTWVAIRVLPGEEQRFTCQVEDHRGKTTYTAVFGEKLGEPWL
jgi:hypothetical protein